MNSREFCARCLQVIDPGFCKQNSFNPRTGMESLGTWNTNPAVSDACRLTAFGILLHCSTISIYTKESFRTSSNLMHQSPTLVTVEQKHPPDPPQYPQLNGSSPPWRASWPLPAWASAFPSSSPVCTATPGRRARGAARRACRAARHVQRPVSGVKAAGAPWQMLRCGGVSGSLLRVFSVRVWGIYCGLVLP